MFFNTVYTGKIKKNKLKFIKLKYCNNDNNNNKNLKIPLFYI